MILTHLLLLFHNNFSLQCPPITHIISIHLDLGKLEVIAAMASKILSIAKLRGVISFCDSEIGDMVDLIQEVFPLSTMDLEDIAL